MRNRVFYGNALDVLRGLPEDSVHCCVCSPPYWGLRSYLPDAHPNKADELGLESTPEKYIERMVEIFREVRRVLRPDGTLWLNLGDSYAATSTYRAPRTMHTEAGWKQAGESHATPNRGLKHETIKPKDLVAIPWMTALALRSDGWWLRSEVIWPESVTDRPSKAHEHVFLLTKQDRYFYDAEAVRENNRSRRDVWTIHPKPYKGAHFAVMPFDLAEVCIKAGTSEKGCCEACGAPLKRLVERPKVPRSGQVRPNPRDGGLTAEQGFERSGMSHFKYNEWLQENPPVTVGWERTCKCEAGTLPCIVLDPFSGSGTTLMTAKDLNRDFVGIELNEGYQPLIEERLGPSMAKAGQRELFEMASELDDLV